MDVNEEFPMPSHAYESGKDDEDNKTSEEENRKYEEENKKLDEENRDYEKEYRKSLISRLYEEENRKKQELIMRKSGVFEKNDKDSDIMYSMFYGDEDNDSNKKHALHYDERSNINKESVLTTESDLDDYDKKPTIETSTESEYANEENSNLNQNESNNIFFGVNAELTTPSSKGKSTNVSKRICSLIKLRNLNFNSPHTLAEVR
ncbi:unnamed protein product [Diatraea saccharalis]|uniref:Uncharacterized protein n=1 Tax=Diatraea saccharalis TaxID=40085 RepID=A0A9N9QYX5_9NEOP|nr:unnamed protein product [Diatraea saccharalis]